MEGRSDGQEIKKSEEGVDRGMERRKTEKMDMRWAVEEVEKENRGHGQETKDREMDLTGK